MRKNQEKYEFRVPTSLKEARTRVDALTIDILNVEKQLGDRRREKTMEIEDYDSWREKTKAARIFMVAELRMLKEWTLERRRCLLAKESDIWPDSDPRTMLRRVLTEARLHIRGEENSLVETLTSIDLYLHHDA